MKKFLFILLCVPMICHAEQWMETSNEAGGKILFLATKCDDTKDGRMVIATTSQGDNINGCWWYFADMIHVVWKNYNGKTSSFDPKTLTYRKTNE